MRLPFPLLTGSRSKHGPEPGPEVVELVEEMECVHLMKARTGELWKDCGEVRGDEKVATSLARRTLAFAPALCCCAAKVKDDGQR
jgi:hypothetical protein